MIDHDGGPIVRVVQWGKILNHLCNFRSMSRINILVSILPYPIIWKCKEVFFFGDFFTRWKSCCIFILNSVIIPKKKKKSCR